MFVEKKNVRLCLCIFESDTVKSDSPVQEIMKYLKIKYRLPVYFTCFTVYSGDIKETRSVTMNI